MTDDLLQQVLRNHALIIENHGKILWRLGMLMVVCLVLGGSIVTLIWRARRFVEDAKAEVTGYLQRAEATLTAMLALAESARDNRKEAVNAKSDMAAKVDANTERLERTIPVKTAEKVAEVVRDGGGSGTHLGGH